jgi:hypothetical protein
MTAADIRYQIEMLGLLGYGCGESGLANKLWFTTMSADKWRPGLGG